MKIRKSNLIKNSLLFTVLVLLLTWWHYNKKQNRTLDRSELLVPIAMELIETGEFDKVQKVLNDSKRITDSIKNQFATSPDVRQREQNISAHLVNLEASLVKERAFVAQTNSDAIKLLKLGKLDEAKRLGITAIAEAKKNIQLISLSKYLKSMAAQDFEAAEDAADEMFNVVSDQSSSASSNLFSQLVQQERKSNFQAQSRIAKSVRNLIASNYSKESNYFKPILKGKAMVWDATRDTVEKAYELLPDNLRASAHDGIVTIFSIIKREQIIQGYYSISNQPGYQEKMVIGVVYWPAKRNAGTTVVWGNEPRGSRPVSYVPEYGSSVNIRDWISSLTVE